MIISPPFLPQRTASDTDETWLEKSMPEKNTGRFPVSSHNVWHGGIHVEAPLENGARLPVCSIADGIIVYSRQPTAVTTDPLHPLNYGDPDGRLLWTDDGCVVIRHETEIGADSSDTPIPFVYFSIYVHLNTLHQNVQDAINNHDGRIYRKEPIGTAGQIYGEPDTIHFEIICDNSQLQNLIGREIGESSGVGQSNAGNLPYTQDGRNDVFYGEMYFHIPANTSYLSRSPVEYRLALQAARDAQPPGAPPISALPNPPVVNGALDQDIIVGIKYHEGDATIKTYSTDGTIIGATPVSENEFEYIILETAQNLRRYVELDNLDRGFPGDPVPSASACLELLQCGRILGPEILTPPNTPNWRLANLPGSQQGWINLNANNVHKFSDADFPQWRSWVFLTEDRDNDSRCDSSFIRNLLDQDQDNILTEGETDPTKFTSKALTAFKKVVATFPTEWNETDIGLRWHWVTSSWPDFPDPLDQQEYQRLILHAQALGFWSKAGMFQHISNMHWHLSPKKFIQHMKQCAWFSATELAQCIPRQDSTGQTHWSVAKSRSNDQGIRINRMLRKYAITSTRRRVHFLAGIMKETGKLNSRFLIEHGVSSAAYWPFKGRGYIHLTWPAAYEPYGEYRNYANQTGPYTTNGLTHHSIHPWSSGQPARRWFPRYDINIVEQPYNLADSSGFYWIWKKFHSNTYTGPGNDRRSMNRVADKGYEAKYLAFTAWLINGNNARGNQIIQEIACYCRNIIEDTPLIDGIVVWRYPSLPNALTNGGNFPNGNPSNNTNVRVDYQSQRP